jgi:hypothetical protein
MSRFFHLHAKVVKAGYVALPRCFETRAGWGAKSRYHLSHA